MGKVVKKMNMTTNNWDENLNTLLSKEEPGRPALGQPDNRARQAETILLVDDDADWCHECAFTLQTLGYEPIVALEPSQALDLFLSHDVSIAIVDYNMPGQDGITLIQQLSASAEAQGRRLHFIMATGYATKDVAIDAMRASAVDFLEKPIRQADLQNALQRINGLRDDPAAREALVDKMASLSDELQRLSRLIHEPAAETSIAHDGEIPRPANSSDNSEVDEAQICAFIRDALKQEARRRKIGAGELFGDPAWEMLLDLLLAKMEDRQVSVSSACIASGAPMSTALRLVRRLVSEGVLFRVPDEHDRRRHFLIINPKLEQPLIHYLSDQIRSFGPSGAN